MKSWQDEMSICEKKHGIAVKIPCFFLSFEKDQPCLWASGLEIPASAFLNWKKNKIAVKVTARVSAIGSAR